MISPYTKEATGKISLRDLKGNIQIAQLANNQVPKSMIVRGSRKVVVLYLGHKPDAKKQWGVCEKDKLRPFNHTAKQIYLQQREKTSGEELGVLEKAFEEAGRLLRPGVFNVKAIRKEGREKARKERVSLGFVGAETQSQTQEDQSQSQMSQFTGTQTEMMSQHLTQLSGAIDFKRQREIEDEEDEAGKKMQKVEDVGGGGEEENEDVAVPEMTNPIPMTMTPTQPNTQQIEEEEEEEADAEAYLPQAAVVLTAPEEDTFLFTQA